MVIQASYNGIMSVGLDDLLSEKGAVARRLQGFEVRPQQIEMAAAVQRTLEQRGRLVVEAGTSVSSSPPTPSTCRSSSSRRTCRCCRR